MNRHFMLICLLLLSLPILGQETENSDSTQKVVEEKIDNLTKALNEVRDRLAKSEIRESELVGVISYDNTQPVPLYYSGKPMKKSGRTLLVDRVSLHLKDGYIVEIQVFSGKKKYTNTISPIAVTSKRFMKLDFLRCATNSSEYILLRDVISWEAFNSYFPDDGLIRLTPSHMSDTLSRNVGVNSVLDVRLYTDALGTFGETPNGVVQTDARFKQFLHRRNDGNTGRYWFHYMKVNLNASKFDSDNKYVDSSNFSRTGLFQRSFLNAEFAVNLMSNWIETKSLSSVYVDAGGGVSISKLAGLHDTSFITIQYLFAEVGFQLRTSSNIGADIYGRGMVQYSPQSNFKDNNNSNAVWFLRFGGEVYWNPFGDVANRIFGRVNYCFSTKVVEKKYHFTQVQLGYSVLLSKLIGK